MPGCLDQRFISTPSPASQTNLQPCDRDNLPQRQPPSPFSPYIAAPISIISAVLLSAIAESRDSGSLNMMRHDRTLGSLALLATLLSLSCAEGPSKQVTKGLTSKVTVEDRESLMSLQVLTFTDGGYTTARRGDPHPQLECVGGAASRAKGLHPVRVDCYNTGVDEASPPDRPRPKWHCVTALHRGVRVDNWDVHCEGWSYPDDDFILRGSCWLSYNLEYEEQVPLSEVGQDAASAVAEDPRTSKGFWGFLPDLPTLFLWLVGIFVFVMFVMPSLRKIGRNRTQREVSETVPLLNKMAPL